METKSNYIETIKIINETKIYFENQLEQKLGIIKVQSPIFLNSSSGLQDQLSGLEEPICFKIGNENFEIIHSLAKWKREALYRYKFPVYTGLYTDMKAIRKDEVIDNIHSLYVEQWDWEKVIDKNDRTIEYLKETVRKIYNAIRETFNYIKVKYKFLNFDMPNEIFFITSQELENLYIDKKPQEREHLIVKEKKAVFIIGIGNKLKSGKSHDLRSPDYDDWELNGDLLLYHNKLSKAIEISSMGIRVDDVSLKKQLEESKCMDRIKMPYHQKILNNKLPYTIGGGIGQSRILMFLLQKSHIAEVQASSWGEKDYKQLENIKIL